MTFFQSIERANEAYMALEGIAIPASIRKPRCVKCGRLEYADCLCFTCWRTANAQAAREMDAQEPRVI